MPKYNLLSVNQDAKTIKSNDGTYLTGIVYTAPAKQVEGVNMCAMAARAGCAEACLFKAGRGSFSNVQAARIRKTMLFRDNRAEFLRQLCEDIDKFERYCKKKDLKPCIRLNGTSDINYERFQIMESFPNVQFYDYTKNINRAYKKLPENYHLTLSYSEANKDYAEAVFKAATDTDKNMAVVFRGKQLPKTFRGLPVFNADKDDLRFLDPINQVAGLLAKGPAKKDATGFVIDPVL